MSIDLQDEILQDFLVEAGEILDQLGEQLVELERRPTDKDLLNAVFRGFHTIKGGAGFINLTALVEVCHRAEDVFNILRQGERQVDAELMDVILQVLDIVNQHFSSIKEGEDPEHAPREFLNRLEVLARPASAGGHGAAPVPAPPGPGTGLYDNAPQDFAEQLPAGDATAQGSGAAPEPSTPAAADELISDEEFESLLDQLHGPGQHGGTLEQGVGGTPATEVPGTRANQLEQTGGDEAGSDERARDITDEEFEELLNRLHGDQGIPGQGPTDDENGPVAAQAAPAPPPRAAGMDDVPKAPEARAEPVPGDREHGLERAPAKEAPHQEATIRVDTKRLDDIMNLVGELVLVRNRLSTLRSCVEDEEVDKAVSNLDLVTSDLQTAAMKTRMQPIKKVFGRFPRVVRDIARNLNKEVTLELVGEETDLDKNLVEALADPLVHLVRNAVDHGIEQPDVREAAGKPRCGTIVLSAKHAGDHIQLAIEDDGGGMDARSIRNKALEKGVIDEDTAARLDDRESFNLIFVPGFSTKEEISDVSGRGVGMDVVKSKITQLNGAIDVTSEQGTGTSIIIKVPLTLAILPTLMVDIGDQIFALPLSSVSEIFDLDLSNTKIIDGKQVVLIRDSAMPVFHLQNWLIGSGRRKEAAGAGHVVVVNNGNQQIGFVVDKLIGQEEVVIKPLGAMLRCAKGLAGATITGDGRIALILDVPSLVSHYIGK